MTTTSQEVVALLKATAGVVAKLADGGAVFTDAAPEGQARPLAVVQVVEDPRSYSLSGATGLDRAMVTVACLGDTDEDALELAAAVLSAVELYSGTVAATGRWEGCFLRGRRGPVAVDPADGSEEYASEVELDLEVWRRS